MSRNSELRKVADKLPSIPLVRNGHYVSDRGYGAGNRIMVDHFKVMMEMKDRLPQPRKPNYAECDKITDPVARKNAKMTLKEKYWLAHHKLEIQVIGEYTMTVYNTIRKRRNKRIATVLKWTVSAITLGGTALLAYWRSK